MREWNYEEVFPWALKTSKVLTLALQHVVCRGHPRRFIPVQWNPEKHALLASLPTFMVDLSSSNIPESESGGCQLGILEVLLSEVKNKMATGDNQ